ncbi:MAG: hypothetical protein J5805_06940 [Bacteroidaceae bacterium]|nr:hypothetical protein [Bacteroidaceae bacterium]
MKKIIFNCILTLAVIGLAGACFMSIYADIEFDKQRKDREKVVIARLLQIRNAEEKFRMSHQGEYCGTLDSLIDWVANDSSIDKIIKDGELSDDQLESGMTEQEAVKLGLIRRDTIWISASKSLGIDHPDSLRYIPIGKAGAVFQLRKHEAFNVNSKAWDKVLEIRASLDDYLDGMNAKKIKGLKSDLKKKGKNRADLFADNEDDLEGEWYGLRVGDIRDPQNKLSGNWE